MEPWDLGCNKVQGHDSGTGGEIWASSSLHRGLTQHCWAFLRGSCSCVLQGRLCCRRLSSAPPECSCWILQHWDVPRAALSTGDAQALQKPKLPPHFLCQLCLPLFVPAWHNGVSRHYAANNNFKVPFQSLRVELENNSYTWHLLKIGVSGLENIDNCSTRISKQVSVDLIAQ